MNFFPPDAKNHIEEVKTVKRKLKKKKKKENPLSDMN